MDNTIFFWGLLSLLQICTLPGLLVSHKFDNKKMGMLEKIVFVFALSLIINYLGVFALTVLGLYQRLVVFVIFAAEIALVLARYRSVLALTLESASTQFVGTFRNVFQPLIQEGERSQAWQKLLKICLYAIFLLAALSSIFWALRVLFNNSLTVFSVWDAVVSWNRWAVDWFSNHLPELTRRYGQLIPANWSISYVFMGSSQIQFFAKSIMPLFTLFILLLTLLLGLEFRSYGFLAAVFLTQLMFKKFLGVHVYSGYVDTAVSFFSFASMYCLIKAMRLTDKASIKSFISLGAIMAAGALCTKQPGLYILAGYPLLVYFLITRNNRSFKKADIYRALVYPFLIALAISLPWYLYTEATIYLGANKTEFEWIVEEVHRGRTLFDRFVFAAASLEKYAALYLLCIVSVPFLSKPFRWLLATIILPYSLFWALYASYSHRNLAIVLPLLGLVSGAGFEGVMEFAQAQLQRSNIRKLPILLVGTVLLGLGILSSLSIPDAKLTQLQIQQQREILIRGINKELYDYFETTGEYGVVLTDYPMEFLPDFEHRVVGDSFDEYESYLRHRSEHPEIEYLLMPKTADQRIIDEVLGKIETGSYELIFNQNGYWFVKIQ